MMLVNFKAALAARQVRQVDLAISLGISPSVLSEIVNGRRMADPGLRSRIAKELSVDETWLFVSHASVPAPRHLGVELNQAPFAIACSGRETS